MYPPEGVNVVCPAVAMNELTNRWDDTPGVLPRYAI
jgi:hypothetical protein